MSSNNIEISNPALLLIQDLTEIHDNTDIRISEIDDKVNKFFILVEKNKIKDIKNDFEDLRLELWIGYTNKNLESVETELKFLAIKLVKISEYKTKINNIRRNFNKIDRETLEFNITDKEEYFLELNNIFNKINLVWNELEDNKDDLIRDAWFKFFTLVYLPVATIIGAAIWILIQKYHPEFSILQVIVWESVVLTILFFTLLKVVQNPFKEINSEVEDEE